MKTYSQKPVDVQRKWYLLDASEASLGRLSTKASSLLLGKGKATVTPHTDGGDFVVIINADKVKLTGGKELKKKYFRHSGFPGGIYKRSFSQQQEKSPESIIQKSVRGMLPDNKLRPARLARLKIYAGEEHNHTAQRPEKLSIKGDS
ncbi:MAG TPA: 50S ribosomal protein L13 [Candidatus Saccharimonadales bacterium]|nr:50S ribosomal protein L13 [Candidatus Saccharimonadales bacterium]